MNTPPEGVAQFHAEHTPRALEPWIHGETVRRLSAWREILARLRLLGQDPERYGGFGFGNMSARVGPFGAVARGRRSFLVTGTQTGGRRTLELADFCIVETWDMGANRLTSVGHAQPSSESLTHGAIYDVAPSARVVMHVHAPEIWRNARALGLAATPDDVPNGTPEMARSVQRLVRETQAGEMAVLAMGGHEDGVIAFGDDAESAGGTLVRCFARACTIERVSER